MPLHPTWYDIALRLILTVIAGGVIGFNRGVQGHAAGLRTTILVGLAGSVAMIQANILLSVDGRAPDSFGTMDPLRLSLGILTGVGFIGGGAILRRGDLVTGVTTAATLWVMTVIGLCFGGGQLILGAAATGLAFVTLWGLTILDARIPRDHRGVLVIRVDPASFSPADLAHLIEPLGCTVRFRGQDEDHGQVRLSYDVCWKRPDLAAPPDSLPRLVNQRYPVVSFQLAPESHH